MSEGRAGRHVPILEWLCGLAGAAAAVAMIGFLVFEGATRAQAPAELKVEIAGTRDTPSGLALDVRITNTGGTTAADVLIRTSPGERTGETTIDFVPPMSERRAVLVVPRGSDPGALSVTVRGYRAP
ncbi:hypothetical protein ACLBXM_13860 [Xanthobacteraceae bacterium A53D]